MLGQVKVAGKSNEIVAIPKLLDMLTIEGAVITMDAMGCQRAIAQKIVDKKADYVLALKGDQSALHGDVKLFAIEQQQSGFKDAKISRAETIDGDHGRIETRTITVFHDIEWLRERHDWPGLAAVVMVKSIREISSHRPDCARSLGHREQPALGDGHGLPRRRGTRPNRSRGGQLHDHQTTGRQPDTAGPGQAFHASSPQDSRMGRRFPRKLGQGMISFTRFP